MNNFSRLKLISAAVCGVIFLMLTVSYFIFKADVFIASVVFAVLSVVLLLVNISIEKFLEDSSNDIQKKLDASVREAMKEANVGVLVYNENYVITWMSDFFNRKNLKKNGEKILSWLPELEDLLKGDNERTTIVINEDKYTVSKKADSYVLFFKDITKEYDLQKKLKDDALVLGLLSFDNYDESSESLDDVSYINSNIIVPVVDYFKKYNIVFKTLRSNRMLLILDKKQFDVLKHDRFSILTTVRKESKKADLGITLSMAFSYGSEDYVELDEEVNELLEIAQTRGGDQVVERKVGEEALFFGGSSEAKEKQSKIKVRVMANTLKELIQSCSNVFIMGHKDSDADSIGAAIAVSNIVSALKKDAYIICKSGGVEQMISDVLDLYSKELDKKHHFINEVAAINTIDENSLVIMVDHHSKYQSAAPGVFDYAKKIAIIDHHRRRADFDVEPLFIYVEASASSSTEQVVEFLPYIGRSIDITSEEANIMYLGLLIDTQRFKNRTGVRTFDVARILRQYGADPLTCDGLLQEPFDMVLKRSGIINEGKMYYDNILVSSLITGVYSRSIASQACDEMVNIKNVEAAFVICNTVNDEVMISARSKGNINVQVILEKMGGGGHMSAAGLQRKNAKVSDVTKELLSTIDIIRKEEIIDESNIAE